MYDTNPFKVPFIS